jgi:hypothetical protein
MAFANAVPILGPLVSPLPRPTCSSVNSRKSLKQQDHRAFGDQLACGTNASVRRRWAAIAVESIRVDGKPTQRHIAYLGCITESAIPIMHKRYYSGARSMTSSSASAAGSAERDGGRIQRASARKVSRLTKAEAEQVKRDAVKYGVTVTPQGMG